MHNSDLNLYSNFKSINLNEEFIDSLVGTPSVFSEAKTKRTKFSLLLPKTAVNCKNFSKLQIYYTSRLTNIQINASQNNSAKNKQNSFSQNLFNLNIQK